MKGSLEFQFFAAKKFWAVCHGLGLIQLGSNVLPNLLWPHHGANRLACDARLNADESAECQVECGSDLFDGGVPFQASLGCRVRLGAVEDRPAFIVAES